MIISSEPVIRRVVGISWNRIGTYRIEQWTITEELEAKAIMAVMKNLSINTGNNNIISLRFNSQDPRIARDVLDNMVEVYMDRHIEVHQVEKTPRFFRNQFEKFYTVLEAKEREYKKYCDKQGIISIEGQKNACVERI